MVGALQVFGYEWATWVFLALGLCLVGIVALIVGAIWMHGDAQSRGMDATVWVILLIVATLLGGIVGFAIVFIIYLVVRESHPVGAPFPVGYGPPPQPGAPAACPVCGRPMTWYSEYGRWYCPSCGQYR